MWRPWAASGRGMGIVAARSTQSLDSTNMSRRMQIAAIVIGAILFTGLFSGAFGIAETWLVRGELPKGEWWHFLVAILIIGVVAPSLEAIGEGMRHAFGAHKRGAPKWRQLLAIVTSIAAVVAILLIYNLARS